MLLLLLVLMTSVAVERAAGRCDFDHRSSYESRPCSAWSLHDDANGSGRFVLLTGSRVSTDNVTRSLLPAADHSEGTGTGETNAAGIVYRLVITTYCFPVIVAALATFVF